jgi:COP9 signalosome complex subunit 3
MSAELTSMLLSFQPDSPELAKRRDYDSKARYFVSQLANVPSALWVKGADTQQDVLSVGQTCGITGATADSADIEPRR